MIYALKFEDANAIGFFAMACSPGGSASNAYTYLLAGDVSLSVTMTLCSTILSLGKYLPTDYKPHAGSTLHITIIAKGERFLE